MDDEHIRAFEQILLFALQHDPKAIAFFAPECGPSSGYCARGLAEISARASRATLLVDLADPTTPTVSWFPPAVQSSNGRTSTPADLEDNVIKYLLSTVPWLDVSRARETLGDFFSQYGLVVFNLPALLGAPDGSINPIAAGAACDQVFLVCQRGRLRRQRFGRAMQLVKSGGCKISGIVNDERCYESPGRQIATMAGRFAAISPRFARAIARYALASHFLN